MYVQFTLFLDIHVRNQAIAGGKKPAHAEKRQPLLTKNDGYRKNLTVDDKSRLLLT